MKILRNLILIVIGLNIIFSLNVILKTILFKPIFSEFVNQWLTTLIFIIILSISIYLTDLINKKMEGRQIVIGLLFVMVISFLAIAINLILVNQ